MEQPSYQARYQKLSSTSLSAIILMMFSSNSFALPDGGVVGAGEASIISSPNKVDIIQNSQKAIIDWRGFDIGTNEQTQFHQPNASSIAINRVNSPSPTQIDGQLNANGNVVIINQNGVMFGQNAKVDVNGLLATTADASNADLMKDGALHLNKAGNSDAAVINAGQINARDAGLVGLVAPNVLNSGTINAKLGRVALSSGDTAVVDFYGDGLLQVAVSDKVKSQLVANTSSGKITADGGTIQITAAAGREIVNSLITVEGRLQAQSVAQKGGEIIIAGSGSNAVAGNVAVHKGLKQGSSVVLVSGALDASGRGTGERGGKVSVLGDEIALLNGTIIDVSGHSGAVDTTKGKAISSERKGAAGGEVKIGGDYLGQGATSTAKNLYVAKGAYVFADSTNKGDAGRAIFWSDDTTKFYGNVFARSLAGNGVDSKTGDAKPSPFGRGQGEGNLVNTGNQPSPLGRGQGEGLSGNGGFVETSGHKNLDVGGYVNLTASNGERGTYFLDPTNITIYGNVDPTFQSTDGTSINLAPNLRLWLDGDDIDGDGVSEDSAEAGLVTGAGNCGTAITCVATWTDKSGNNNNATQATPANRPQFSSNAQNGRDVLSFNSDYLTLTSGVGASSQSAASFTIVGESSAANTAVLGSADQTNINLKGSSQFRPEPYAGGLVLAGSTAGSTDVIDTQIHNGTSYARYVGGIQTGTITSSANIKYDGTTWIMRGDGSGGGTVHSGQISEITAYNTALSTLPRNLIEQYQSAKWGIGLDPISGTAIGGGAEVAEATAHNAALPNDAATNGYSVFTTRYLERLSQSANISLQASNNINLDLKGDNLNFTTANRSLTLTAGNQITTASAGTITTNNGAINLNANNGILFNHAFTLNSGTATTTLNGNNGNIILPSITSSSILAQTTSAAADISSAAARLTATGAGGITLNSGRDVNLSATGLDSSASNAPVSITAGRTAYLAPINTGTGNLTINAVDAYLYGADTTTGLVGYWNFNEGSGTVAGDSSGNGNNGTLINSPTWSASTPFGTGNSLSFSNATPSYVLATPIIGSTASFSYWATYTGANNIMPFALAAGFPGPDVYFQAGKVFWNTYDGASNPFGNIPANAADGNFHNYSFIVSAGQTAFYYDGTFVGNAAYRNPTSNRLQIGGQSAYGWSGKIDDFRLYNTALTSDKISKLYNGTSWNVGSTSINASGNVTLDLNGDTLAASAGKNIGINAGSSITSASAGNVTAAKNAGVGGDITLSAGGSGTANISNLALTSTGGAVSVTSPSAVTLGNISAQTILAQATGGAADITIPVGRILSASGAGDAITLAAGRNIINNAGAGALSAASGRWLLYSTNPTDTTGEELLASNFNRYNCTYTACNAGVTIPANGNGLIYSFVPTLSVTGLSSSKSFDGNANAPLTGATLSGTILAGDTGISLDGTGVTGAFADELVGTAKPITLTGLYTLGGTNYGYNLLQPTGVTGTITAASSGGGGGWSIPQIIAPPVIQEKPATQATPKPAEIIVEKPKDVVLPPTPVNPTTSINVAIPNTVQINSQIGLIDNVVVNNSMAQISFENRPPLDLNEDNSVVTSNDNVSNNSNQSDEAKSNEKQSEQNLADNKINQTQQNLSLMGGILKIHPKLQQLFSIKKL